MDSGDRAARLETSPESVGQSSTKSDKSERKFVVLCSEDALLRDCLERALQEVNYDVYSVASVDQWLQEADNVFSRPLFIFFVGAKSTADPVVHEQIEKILQLSPQPRLIIAGETDDTSGMIEAMNAGAKGYFSPDTSLNIALVALELVRAGGVYLPPSIVAYDDDAHSHLQSQQDAEAADLLTSRQKAVVAALRKGMSNKIIAYELNMCESTVKVHVRNIMKKLGAKNRTEVAFLTQKLFQSDETTESPQNRR